MRRTDSSSRPLTKKEIKDLRVLAQFTSVYCQARHEGRREPLSIEEKGLDGLRLEAYPLCPECRNFLAYAIERRLRCPLDPKPVCKHCPVHCYRAGHRQRVREVMRFSGRYLILRGRLDLFWHYFF